MRFSRRALISCVLASDRSLLRELGWIRHAIPLVVRRGDASAGRAVFTALSRMRRDGGTSERQTALGEALAAFERPDVVRALAETLLFGGDATQREAARLLLAGVEGAAESLVRVVTSLRAQPRQSGGARGSLRKSGR